MAGERLVLGHGDRLAGLAVPDQHRMHRLLTCGDVGDHELAALVGQRAAIQSGHVDLHAGECLLSLLIDDLPGNRAGVLCRQLRTDHERTQGRHECRESEFHPSSQFTCAFRRGAPVQTTGTNYRATWRVQTTTTPHDRTYIGSASAKRAGIWPSPL